MEVCGQRLAPAALTPGKETQSWWSKDDQLSIFSPRAPSIVPLCFTVSPNEGDMIAVVQCTFALHLGTSGGAVG